MTDGARADGTDGPSDFGETVDPRLEGLAQDIVHTIRQPILILDDQLGVVTANPAFYDHFGMAEAQTLGRSVFELGSGEWDIPALREVLLEVIPRDTSVEEFQVEHEFDELGPRIILVSARQLERVHGGTDLILLIMDDVTERVRAERELRRSNADLEHFAYHASHDLQEPLRMVASYTQLLARRYEGELDEKADKYIAYAVEGAERMKELINDLLEYSRAGGAEATLEAVDPEDVLEQATRDLERAIADSGAEISHDDLPPAMADPVQLRQVLQNLLENAIKFSGDGPPVIHVSGEPRGNLSVYSVADQGPGIDQDELETVFGMFQRLGKQDKPGSGLGLALCRKIIQQHGGEMWAESEEGRGTTVYFTLPSVDEEPAP